jgi:hypothetical protein
MTGAIATVVFTVLFVAFQPLSAADEWDKKTRVTFNAPVEVPGKILDPGTYTFKVMDLLSTRTVVRIANADETEVYATIIGIPDFRLTVTDETRMNFYEALPGAPHSLRAWFYPGRQYGIEFAYPKGRAGAIARTSAEHVLAYVPEEPAEVPAEPVPAEVTPLIEAPVVAITPEGEEVPLEAVHPPEPEVFEPEVPAQLPRTATPLPLIMLLGAGAALGAGLLRSRS